MGPKSTATRFLKSLGFARGKVPDALLEPYRRQGADPSRVYGKFAYRSEASVVGTPKPVEFEAVGDTLHLDELVGSEALYVKVGDQGNPWVRMEEGDELRRRFDKVWVTHGGAQDTDLGTLARAVTEATFLHSWGSLKKKGDKSYGFRRGFKAFRGSASATEQSLFAPLQALAPGVPLVFGKRGGTIVVRNRDSSNVLLLRHGVVGAPGSEDYWELYPGEALPIAVASRVHSMGDTIVVKTPGGACLYGFLCSAFDVDRADLNQTIMRGV